MKALTVKQPWASLIVDGIKDIENRTWATKFRGRVLIHAASKPDKLNFEVSGQATAKEITMSTALNYAEENELFGCIIGSVEIIDCVEHHISEWAIPFQKHWVLANPILFKEPILNVKGKLSFWDYEFDESTYECTNDNPYTHQSVGERIGCIQNCDECDYWKSKYDIEIK